MLYDDMRYARDIVSETIKDYSLSKESIKQFKDENTILIDNGDCIQGSPQTFYFNLNYNVTLIICKIADIVSKIADIVSTIKSKLGEGTTITMTVNTQ